MKITDTPPPCPICGSVMLAMYGCYFDNDRFVCGTRYCDGEIELDTTSLPDESADEN
jgi:ribosomal protein S27AE